MKKIIVKELDKKRFDALAGYSRSPAAAYFSQELEWYSNEEESVIGTVLLDTVDEDYAAVVLARDESGKFRAFDVESSMENVESAKIWIVGAIKWHTGQGIQVAPEDDELKTIDLLTPVLPPEKLNPFFCHLINDKIFLPARSIIREMMPHFVDIDGNFVEQFQSTGFDSRLWELYLNAYLSEEELFIQRDYQSPDFIVMKYGQTIAIEAVIVGRKENNPPKYFKPHRDFPTPEKILTAHKNSMPIKFGSPLYSKLQKKYWRLPHVSGHPLVFAIADFHDDQSMLWSSTALINYLYGVDHKFHYDDSHQLVITPFQIDSHTEGNKEVPSGYFFQPEAENVSAVLFSASGTLSKFNRIGRQAGFHDPNIQMYRIGTCHDHNPNASVPRIFRYKVDETSNETWAEGLSMFHNPNAIHPVPEELFPTIQHHFLREGQIVSHLPEFSPYSSITLNLTIK